MRPRNPASVPIGLIKRTRISGVFPKQGCLDVGISDSGHPILCVLIGAVFFQGN